MSDETEEKVVAESEAPRWCDAIDWSNRQPQDNPLLFSLSGIVAPLTYDNLLPAATSYTLGGCGDDYEFVKNLSLDEMRTSPLIAYPYDYQKPDDVTIDGQTYRLGYGASFFGDLTFADIYTQNRLDLYVEGCEQVRCALGIGELPDPQDGRGDAYLVEEACLRYGLPTLDILHWGHEILWERDGYRFGLYLDDTTEETGDPSCKVRGFVYVSGADWENHVGELYEDYEAPTQAVPFVEYLAGVRVADEDEWLPLVHEQLEESGFLDALDQAGMLEGFNEYFSQMESQFEAMQQDGSLDSLLQAPGLSDLFSDLGSQNEQ